MPTIDEQSLVRQVQEGDQRAFGELMDMYLPRIFSLAKRYTGNASDAEDIAQETFIQAYLNIKQFRNESKFSTWLYRIAINQALKLIKKPFRIKETEIADDAFQTKDTQTNALDQLMEEDRRKTLESSIQKLPPKQRSVLLLRIEKHLSFKEISHIMKRSIGGVKANYFHAVRALEDIIMRNRS